MLMALGGGNLRLGFCGSLRRNLGGDLGWGMTCMVEGKMWPQPGTLALLTSRGRIWRPSQDCPLGDSNTAPMGEASSESPLVREETRLGDVIGEAL